MPTFPDVSQPAQYPKTLSNLVNVQVNTDDPEDTNPDTRADAEKINFILRNLVAAVDDMRDFIVALGLDPDSTDNLETAAQKILSYTPSAPADWAGSPPATVVEALDRIAAANPGVL